MMRALPCFAAVCVIATSACGGIELEQTGDLPIGSVTSERIEMPVGLAVSVRLKSAKEDEESALVSANKMIMDTSPTGNLHEFIVSAVSVGSTTIDVQVNSESQGEIEAVVTAYPAAPQ